MSKQDTNQSTGRLQSMSEVARHIERHADTRLTLASLAAVAGMSPTGLQKTFKAVFGISPKAYQDAVRLRQLKRSLKEEGSVTEAIYAAGFGSISRVYGEAERNMGMTPKAYRAGGEGERIAYACRNTALGPMLMAATDRGVCCVQFGDDEALLLDKLRQEFPNAKLVLSDAQHAPELDAWIDALNRHISDSAPRPDLPLDMLGTAFQMKVWRFLLRIPRGQVLSYTQLAETIGQPKAVRAVASACARNRIGVLIPCHRVLRGDGGLGGYRWGLERKRALLATENASDTATSLEAGLT
ncbi:methylated-DNA--[protein]-cysteine S-methyltransferase [Marinobacterium sp. D7]|uniref:bifunctional transcriptional activator/DNA repair enzyme AdaA n=1 Tax=Marinobacterium ramblicola TaxID=2849041 RepID=UPI001C2D4719|nr:methylated-DNA--[protein]-cysteine S-methyltransferase [Marinobacterium ramblicola]MBV1787661.1 methylated-DNA--[protein]-cysteine S-methyltransferase [Marinobacterium ramblicola]